MEDFDTLRPRYPSVAPPGPVQASKSPYDYFDGDRECLADFIEQDETERTGDDEDIFESIFSTKRKKDNDDGEDEEEEEDIDPTSSFTFQLKSVGPKLVPFLKTIGLYFVIFVPSDRPSWFAALIKCLPVASLCLFVILNGISLGQQHIFSRKILTGLMFSCLGDALLVWPNYFVEGMIAFSFAQGCYILAFGMEPFSGTFGVLIYAITSIGLGLIMPGVMATQNYGLIIGVPVYFVLLTTMLWRACARIQMFEDILSWSKVCACFGAISFVISDSILGINRFFMDIPNSQTFIMSSYYFAQFCIALSVINAHKCVVRQEMDSSVIDIDGSNQLGRYNMDRGSAGTSHRNVSWGKTKSDSFDSDDEDLTLPKTRFGKQ